MDVSPALLDDFKQLVEGRGISGDTIIINQNNGREEEAWRAGNLGFKPNNDVFHSHRR